MLRGTCLEEGPPSLSTRGASASEVPADSNLTQMYLGNSLCLVLYLPSIPQAGCPSSLHRQSPPQSSWPGGNFANSWLLTLLVLKASPDRLSAWELLERFTLCWAECVRPGVLAGQELHVRIVQKPKLHLIKIK